MLFDAAAVFVLPQANRDNERYLFLDTSRTACAKRTGAAASVGHELAKANRAGVTRLWQRPVERFPTHTLLSYM